MPRRSGRCSAAPACGSSCTTSRRARSSRHTHTPESLTRKVDEAKSIARDAQRADADFAERGVESTLFPPVVGPLCTWCDFRAHCPEGQAAGPEKSGWAALEDAAAPGATEV